jgi:hypothetical protein
MGKLARLYCIPNISAKFGSSETYYRVLVRNDKGQLEYLLMTNDELIRIRHRVTMNPEDCPRPTLWDTIISWFM